jgi:hypothetical protein
MRQARTSEAGHSFLESCPSTLPAMAAWSWFAIACIDSQERQRKGPTVASGAKGVGERLRGGNLLARALLACPVRQDAC